MFKDYLKHIYIEGRGEDAEQYFVDFYKNQNTIISNPKPKSNDKKKLKEYKEKEILIQNTKLAALEIRKNNKKRNVHNMPQELGTKNASILFIWKEKLKNIIKKLSANHRVKTDVLLGKEKISIKYGPARLMSGTEDAVIVFYNACEQYGKIRKKEIEEQANILWTTVLKTIKTASGLKGKKDMDEDEIKKLNKAMKKAETWFDNSHLFSKPEFTYFIIKEALTGEAKFGKDSSASATHLLTIDDEKKFKYHYKKITEDVITKVAAASNIIPAWKTASIKAKGEFAGRTNNITLSIFAEAWGHVNQQTKAWVPGYIQKNNKKPVIEEIEQLQQQQNVQFNKPFIMPSLNQMNKWDQEIKEKTLNNINKDTSLNIDTDFKILQLKQKLYEELLQLDEEIIIYMCEQVKDIKDNLNNILDF